MTIITIFNIHHMTLNWDDNQQFVNDCTVLHHVLDIGSQQIFCPPRNNKPFPRFVSKAGKNCLLDTGISILANQIV